MNIALVEQGGSFGLFFLVLWHIAYEEEVRYHSHIGLFSPSKHPCYARLLPQTPESPSFSPKTFCPNRAEAKKLKQRMQKHTALA